MKIKPILISLLLCLATSFAFANDELGEKLSKAVATGKTVEVLKLLKNPDTNVNYKRQGLSVLGWAVWNKRATYIPLLLDHEKIDVSDGSVIRALLHVKNTKVLDLILEREDLNPLPFYYSALMKKEDNERVVQLINHKNFKTNFIFSEKRNRWVVYNWTPLSLAASYDNAIVAKELLKKGDIKVNLAPSDRTTPLVIAAAHFKSSKVAKLLLEREDIDVNLKTKDKYSAVTPLIEAVRFLNTEMVESLLSRNDLTTLNTTFSWSEDTAFTIALGQFARYGADRPGNDAILEQRKKVVDLFLNYTNEKEPLNINYVNKRGYAPLALAYHPDIVEKLAKDPRTDVNVGEFFGLIFHAKNGSTENVKLILDNEKVIANKLNSNKRNALMVASNGPTVEALLPYIDVDFKNSKDETAFSFAAKRGNFEVVKALIDEGDATYEDTVNNTELLHQMIVDARQLQMFEYLIQLEKTDVNYLCPTCLHSPLHIAAGSGRVAYAKALLALPDIDVNLKNKFGEKPLDYALINQHDEIVKLIFAHEKAEKIPTNSNPNQRLVAAIQLNDINLFRELLRHPQIDLNFEDQWGYTPLSRAIFKGAIPFAQTLLKEAKLDVTKQVKERGRYQSSTTYALILAAKKGYLDIVKGIVNHASYKGGHVNAIDSRNQSAFIASVVNHRAEVSDFLLSLDDFSAAPVINQSPLISALYYNKADLALKLLERPEVDPDSKTMKDPRTSALTEASSRGFVDVVNRLLELDVDINSENHYRYSPLAAASSEAQLAVVKILLQQPDIDLDAGKFVPQEPEEGTVERSRERRRPPRMEPPMRRPRPPRIPPRVPPRRVYHGKETALYALLTENSFSQKREKILKILDLLMEKNADANAVSSSSLETPALGFLGQARWSGSGIDDDTVLTVLKALTKVSTDSLFIKNKFGSTAMGTGLRLGEEYPKTVAFLKAILEKQMN